MNFFRFSSYQQHLSKSEKTGRIEMQRKVIREVLHYKRTQFQFNQLTYFSSGRCLTLLDGENNPLYNEVPKPPRRKSERKPYPTPMKLLIRRAKEQKEARKIEPCKILEEAPGNGLLIPELVEVAHQVYKARESLLHGLSELANVLIPIKRCRFCSEVHVGQVGHEIRTCTGPKSGLRSATHVWRRGGIEDIISFPECFHLYDRVKKPRVGHDERSKVKRLPAIVELCIQAGVDLEGYPTRRRTKPVYWIEGRIEDFEYETEEMEIATPERWADPTQVIQSDSNQEKSSSEISYMTMASWFEIRSGVKKLMEKYSVQTCGYCPEVQVGPKGHKVRMCRASKHQSRNGLHAWQEATVDDIIGPNYVWHSKDPQCSTALANDLKRFYGKAPAVIELCVQAGASVPDEYRSMMRLDVISPNQDEVDLVA